MKELTQISRKALSGVGQLVHGSMFYHSFRGYTCYMEQRKSFPLFMELQNKNP